MMNRDAGMQNRVVAAVQSVEAVSAAEVVVTLAPRSVTAAVPVLVATLACAATLLLLHPLVFADATSLAIAVDTLVVSAVAALLVRSLPPLQRFFYRSHRLQSAVLAAARAEFVRQGVYRTRGRTGVLLFLSVFERQAVLLVDVGITSLLPAAVLEELEQSATEIFSAADFDAGLTAFFDRLRLVAGRHLPKAADDINELDDGLRCL